MTQNSMLDIAADAALIIAAFFVRNAFVLIGLTAIQLAAFLN